ncbi:MAG: hypothetical protein QOF94_104, partial [Acidobacteriaceae bacterium]
LDIISSRTHGLRRGLYSYAASRLARYSVLGTRYRSYSPAHFTSFKLMPSFAIS